MTSGLDLALLESRLARAAAEVLEATRAAAFDPTLAAGGHVGAILAVVDGGEVRLAAAADAGLPLAGPLLPEVVRALAPRLVRPGEVLAVADPRLGLAPGEVAMVRGVFARGRLAGAVASLALHDGLAGGLVVTPLALVAEGEADPSVLDLLAANGRRAATLRGDLVAQAAGLEPGAVLLERVAAETDLTLGVRRLCAAGEARAREALRGRPSDDPPAPPSAAVAVAEPDDHRAPRLHLTLAPDGAGGLVLDFAGSALFEPGQPALAAPRAAAYARLAVARALPDVPVTSGLLDAVAVRLPARSVLDPALPEAPGGGTGPEGAVRLGHRLIDLVHRALARHTPARALGGDADGGTLVLEAADRPGRPGWRCRLALGGGAGASAGADGIPNVPSATSVAPMPSLEALEAAYPIRVVRYALREGGAGAGRYRGGQGVEIEIEVRAEQPAEDVRLAWLGPEDVGAAGVAGGGAGAPPEAETTHGRVRVKTGAGGGYGNPYERAIRLVLEDLAAGRLDLLEARRAYGVAVRPGTTEVDDDRTYRIRNLVFTTLALDDL